MKADVYFCDECGAQKQQSNHWFRAATFPSGQFSIVPWSVDLILRAETPESHLCGMGCAVKAMTKAMEA